jgi:hypothetical protein
MRHVEYWIVLLRSKLRYLRVRLVAGLSLQCTCSCICWVGRIFFQSEAKFFLSPLTLVAAERGLSPRTNTRGADMHKATLELFYVP